MLRFGLAALICGGALLGTASAQAGRTPAGGNPTSVQPGAPAETACPGGTYLTGFRIGHAKTTFSGPAPYCVGMMDDGAWAGNAELHPDRQMSAPQPGATFGDLVCPRDHYVAGLAGHSTPIAARPIVQLTLNCMRITGTGSQQAFSTALPPEVGIPPWPMVRCPSNEVGNGMFGTTIGGRLIQFGLSCALTVPAQRIPLAIPKDFGEQQLAGSSLRSDGKIAAVSSLLKLKGGSASSGSGQGIPIPSMQPQGLEGTGVPSAPSQPELPAPPPQPQAAAPLPESQVFENPTSQNGLRLHACLSANGDGCGKPAADYFCRQQGFAGTTGFNTDTKKVQAETPRGEPCTKKKCKVFERIACAGAAPPG
jgi:hypothetical protein